ncbi:mammalian cell entry protein [Rhodococcus sp. G-MC3]|uniref:mammalian cell entry protein n=1 Tax=Rhodococcus sp. G-MC3 TaxID=3046209 RepID=UPI0024BB26F6|nr:mammalian cell entry protein [Rhodococcus sp. G-MC3]MDJ0392669.1 mammalian cell entry protein [Rhodococcus sp. G-MC3]
MPTYGLPGATATRHSAIVVGALTLVACVVLVFAVRSVNNARQPDPLQIQLRTSQIGDGIAPGVGVRLNGVHIGTVAAVDAKLGGTQLLTLALDRTQVAGLTDSFHVDYAPSNLFGISEVVLKEEAEGYPLVNGALVDLTKSARVRDVTMGNLLRSLSDTTLTVITPELTDTLNQFASSLDSFTPLLEAMVSVSTAIADTQRYPSSFLIQQYGAFFVGVGGFTDGMIKLVDRIYNIDAVRNDRERFDTGVSLVIDDLFPGISGLLNTADSYLGGYADTFAVLVGQVAQTVPEPGQSHADLSALLDRLDRSFRPTIDGPAIGLDILLRETPVLAVPLLGTHSPRESVQSRGTK